MVFTRGADERMRPAEVAAIFGVTAKTVSRWGRAGTLRPVRTPGGQMRFHAAEVHALAARGVVHAVMDDVE
jgi:excisionase family DNA binding protein